MPLKLENLDAATRAKMAEEIKADVAGAKLYLSNRLSDVGRNDYPILIAQAAQTQSDTWLASELRKNGRLKESEERRNPKGGVTVAKVPVTAPETLSEGEFNRFYIRGLCLRAIADGVSHLTIYRAKEVENPRRESVEKIGTKISAQALLDDLRTNTGVDTALGLPPGPNSGLSVKMP